MNKNSKSRIPMLLTKHKSSKICNDEETLEARSHLGEKKTCDVNKTTNAIQKKTEKIDLQPDKSRNSKDSFKNSDIKYKSSLKTSTKCDITSINNKPFEKSIKPNYKNKVTSKAANIKPNPTDKGITKTFNTNIKTNKRTLSYAKTKTKSNSVENKKENLPSPVSYSFEAEPCTPIGNLVDSKQDCFSAHENVEFEANEIYRKMILSNKELSPGVRKLMPNLRLSSLQSQRPSVYQKLKFSDDPLKEALKALENTCLSVKRIKKENKLPQSPCRDSFRDSIYTPRGDPNAEFLKKLEDFKLKQLQKTAPRSTKKVTFNLNIQECTPKNVCDIQHNALKNSEHRLMQINEKSEENTPNSPINVKNKENDLSDISSKHEHNDISNKTIIMDEENSSTKVDFKDYSYPECKDTKTVVQCDTASNGNQRTLEASITGKPVYQNKEAPLFILKESSSENFSSWKNDEKYTNCLKNSVQSSPSAKIYTPKPISLSSKSKMRQSYSPEFLIDKKSTIMTDLAPICTPLVLKSQSKNMLFSPEIDEGPIPLKLDFTEERDTPKKETCRSIFFALDNIVTIQKQLDDLADQECYVSLINENFPVLCGRYLTNPVARTLNEGDDMHFIPVRL